MKLVDRHLCGEFLRMFLLSGVAFLGLFFVVDFSEKLRWFLKYGAETRDVLAFFAFRLPWMAWNVIPMAALLGTSLSLTLLSRSGAIAAVRGSGVPLRRLALPALGCGLALTAVTAFLQEVVIPGAATRARYIKEVRIKGHSPHTLLRSQDLWLRSGRRILHVDRVAAEPGTLFGVSVAEIEDGRVIRRLDAREARWEEGRWVLRDAVVRTFPDDGTIPTETRDALPYPLGQSPEDFRIQEVKAEEAPWADLKQRLERDRSRGLETRTLEVDLWSKTSLPFASLVMPLLAFPFAARAAGRREGAVLGVALGVALGAAYWLALAVGLSAGKAGALPPPVAAWVGNLAFLALAGVLIWRAEHGR